MTTLTYEHLRYELVKSISDSIAFLSMKGPAFRSTDDALKILASDEAISESRDERIFTLLEQAREAVAAMELDPAAEQIHADLILALDNFRPVPREQRQAIPQ